ncbi:hypothetical protein FACS1894193_13420 [Bacilli bacterium]|nr:hypothetical protein FACS1894193_13420 [Bacilli bacterium]
MKKWITENKWYLVYTFVPILFVMCCTVVAIKVQPRTEATMLIYGVETVEHDKDAGFKISKMVLTDGEIIEYPTIADIREHNLLTYHNTQELNNNLVFPTSMLN